MWPYVHCVVLCLLVVNTCFCAGDAGRKCPDGYFYSRKVKECKLTTAPLSTPPPVRHGDKELQTYDLPWYENLPIQREASDGGAEPERGRDRDVERGRDRDIERGRDRDIERGRDRNSERGRDRNSELTMEKPDWQQWRTLALALIALLSLLILIATIVVVVACLKLQRALIAKQQEDSEIDDADSGYVVIHTIRDMTSPQGGDYSDFYTSEELSAHPPLLASRDTALGCDSFGPPSSSSPPQSLCFLPRVYTPQRRLLTYDADDVFESDDQLAQTLASPQNISSWQAPRDGSIQSIPAVVVERSKSSVLPCQNHRSWYRKKKEPRNDEVEDGSDRGSVGCFGNKRKHKTDPSGTKIDSLK